MAYLEKISVFSSPVNSPPDDYIQEINGLSADINAGFGGNNIWLVAHTTQDRVAGSTHLRFYSTDYPVGGLDRSDLRSSDDDKHRYVVVERAANNLDKVTKVALYRKSIQQGPIQSGELDEIGYDFCSGNINHGRGGDYLYLVHQFEYANATATKSYFEDLVVLTTPEPDAKPGSYYIRDTDGSDLDINAGFEGKRAWLYPRTTPTKDAAATHLRVIVTDDLHPGPVNLSEGYVGNHRYLIVEHDSSLKKKVTKVSMYRKSKELGPIDGPDEIYNLGYNQYTDNVNQDRGGDYLYIVYKVEEYIQQ